MSTNFSPSPRADEGPSTGTVVWGGIVIAVGVLILGTRYLGWFSLDPRFAFVTVLVVLGVGLVVGGALAAAGRRHNPEPQDHDGSRAP